MNNEEFERRKILALTGLQNRMGESEAAEFLVETERNEKNSLEYVGNYSHGAWRSQVIFRLETKLQRIVDEERAQ